MKVSCATFKSIKGKKKKTKQSRERGHSTLVLVIVTPLQAEKKKISFLYAEKVTFSHGSSKDFTLRENDQMSSFIQAPEILIYTT